VPPVVPSPTVLLNGAVNTNAPGFDLVLLAHVITAVVGLVAVVLAGVSALALRRALAQGGPLPEALGRYYRPGVNWAGRVLFLVPVLGVALLVMSDGQWSFADTWVSAGMAVWFIVAMVAETVLWPAERRLQGVVAAAGGGEGGIAADAAGEPVDPARLCLQAGVVGLALGVALVFAGVLMVAQP
jgi:hypothetical protein